MNVTLYYMYMYYIVVQYRGQFHITVGYFQGPGRSRRPGWSYFLLHRSIKWVEMMLNNKGNRLVDIVASSATFFPSKSANICKTAKTPIFVDFAQMTASQAVVLGTSRGGAAGRFGQASTLQRAFFKWQGTPDGRRRREDRGGLASASGSGVPAMYRLKKNYIGICATDGPRWLPFPIMRNPSINGRLAPLPYRPIFRATSNLSCCSGRMYLMSQLIDLTSSILQRSSGPIPAWWLLLGVPRAPRTAAYLLRVLPPSQGRGPGTARCEVATVSRAQTCDTTRPDPNKLKASLMTLYGHAARVTWPGAPLPPPE